MGEAWRYWRFVSISATGTIQQTEIATARAFFRQQFPGQMGEVEMSDLVVQQKLIQQWRDATSDQRAAESCLRCYISYVMQQVCWELEQEFGRSTGLRAADLLGLILDSEVRLYHPQQTTSNYQSLTDKILQTFDGTKGSLGAWTKRLIYSDPDVHRHLMEHGICLLSDWAALNAIHNPNHLRRILADFYLLSKVEIQQNCQLLAAYHAIYRRDRRRQGQSKKRCPPPSEQQLQEMVEQLQQAGMPNCSPGWVLEQLQILAAKIRKYRIAVRLNQLPMDSLDQSEYANVIAEKPTPIDESATEQNTFLSAYQQEFLKGLDHALAQSITTCLTVLQQKRNPVDRIFLDALHRFHCKQQSMAEIAPFVGLQQQYQVARLLKLKQFRADVRQHLLTHLNQRIRELAEEYSDPDRLRSLDRQIEEALSEQIDKMLTEAEAETFTSKCRIKSLFTQRLCHHLSQRIQD
jgi:hypothetical protein